MFKINYNISSEIAIRIYEILYEKELGTIKDMKQFVKSKEPKDPQTEGEHRLSRLKKLYDFRSRIVHGELIREQIEEIDKQPFLKTSQEALNIGLNYLRKLI